LGRRRVLRHRDEKVRQWGDHRSENLGRKEKNYAK